MSYVALEVENCLDCPYVASKEHDTEDEWEIVPFDYLCSKHGNKRIAVNVKGRNGMPPIPDWCPCKIAKDALVRPEYNRVEDYAVGAFIHVVSFQGMNDLAGPFIKTEHSLIDNTGSNWHLAECWDLSATLAPPKDATWEQLNEFRLQVLDGSAFKEWRRDEE